MAVLKEVREKESEIDNLIGPIEEMYALLLRYEVRVLATDRVPEEEMATVSGLLCWCLQCIILTVQVRVPKEETTMVSDLRYGWKKLRKLATDVSDNLTRLQVVSDNLTCLLVDARACMLRMH
eukprot:1158208-Pelagomonas_calceolata.AAC.37